MFIICSLLSYARARRSATNPAALWAGAASYFAVAVPARPFERSELGGLRRRERIATTSTWMFIICSLLSYARARRSATNPAALWAGAASYFAVAVPARPFERSELGGLRRRERIATTSTWCVHHLLAAILRAREAERDKPGRALGRRRIIFRAVAVPARPFERSELGGLRRRERIATTSTWHSVVFSLRFFRPSARNTYPMRETACRKSTIPNVSPRNRTRSKLIVIVRQPCRPTTSTIPESE